MTITKKQFFISATIYLLFWLIISGRLISAQTNIVDYDISPTDNLVTYKYITSEIKDKEIINESTEKIDNQTFRLYPSQQFTNINDTWYQLETATTTKEKFQKPITWNMIKRAIADTFYPTTDGFFRRTGVSETWSNIISGEGNDNQNTNIIDMEISGSAGAWSRMTRAKFVFDTSIIADADTIESGTFNLKVDFIQDTGGSCLNLTNSNTGALANSDYTNANTEMDELYSSETKCYADLTDETYEAWTLNQTALNGIDKAGNTGIGLRWDDDINNTQPSAGQEWTFEESSTAGTDQDPYLELTITEPTPTPTPTPTATTTPYFTTSTSTDLLAQSVITLTSWILILTTALSIIAIYIWIL